MFAVSLAQAEAALDAGRLDEAARLLADAAGHRRGFELRGRLLAALVERGNAHLAAGDDAAAGRDHAAAASIEAGDLAVAALGRELATRERERFRLREREHAAERLGAAGDFSAADRVLAGAESPTVRGRIDLWRVAGRHAPRVVREEHDRARSGPRTAWLLQVGGSARVVVATGGSVRVGPAPDADVRTVGDPSVPGWSFARADDDWALAGRTLADGDRLSAGSTLRARFRRPHPASTTAVLTLTAGRIAGAADATRVLLAGRELVAGPGPAAHAPCDDLDAHVVLAVDSAGLRLTGAPLLPGEARTHEGVRFRLQPFGSPA